METLKRALSLLERIVEKSPLAGHSERIELKRTRSGHWRIFLACAPNTTTADLENLPEIEDGSGFTANPYRRAQFLNSVSFADNEEPARSRG